MTQAPNNVRRLRERKQLTLGQLAAILGTDPGHLSRIERGLVEPRGITKERLAKALGRRREAVFPEDEKAAV
jgi:transcriptional regulator with XRE-family HTH domain